MADNNEAFVRGLSRRKVPDDIALWPGLASWAAEPCSQPAAEEAAAVPAAVLAAAAAAAAP